MNSVSRASLVLDISSSLSSRPQPHNAGYGYFPMTTGFLRRVRWFLRDLI